MSDNSEKINQLIEKLELLLKRQHAFSEEIQFLKIELNKLKNAEQNKGFESEMVSENNIQTKTTFTNFKESDPIEIKSNPYQKAQETNNIQTPQNFNYTSKGKSDLEKFIGENLINKIGIVIMIIGVTIGAKYSIENNLISPLTRIILGYLFGFGLVGFAIKLKNSYENYSAVLLSGAMAIMYVITYSAYDLYALIPQLMAFALMVFFTLFTVIAALQYNRQIIAVIGLVGAYAIPFLLSDGSGNAVILFSYISILNIGILGIAFKKYWKTLYFVSFIFSWFIFLSWYVISYQKSSHFVMSLVFLFVFFAIFYTTFLAYKLLQKEKFSINDVVFLLINSFIFYGIGYSILSGHESGKYLLGVYTIVNAIIHFAISMLVYRQKLTDKNIHYLISGLVLTFITIAIPVQLEGNWVTLVWATEAALLYWIGKTKNVSFIEKLSYPLMILAFFSLLQDWEQVYNTYQIENPSSKIQLFFNINFLSSLLFIVAFGSINLLHFNKKFPSNFNNTFSKINSFAIPAILIYVIYNAFRLEIATYWRQRSIDLSAKINTENQTNLMYFFNNNLDSLSKIWILNYSLFFVSMLLILNQKKIKNKLFAIINLGLMLCTLFVFLTQGLHVLSELRESYLDESMPIYIPKQTLFLWIRYVSFVFVIFAFFASYTTFKNEFSKEKYKIFFDFVFHFSMLCLATSELVNWQVILNTTASNKLGTTILWGIYALFLISFGIWKKNKPLRIGAIVLFGITLLKLFLYDVSHLNTISKTILFVSLGILLLIISFLYNKFKQFISDDETDK